MRTIKRVDVSSPQENTIKILMKIHSSFIANGINIFVIRLIMTNRTKKLNIILTKDAVPGVNCSTPLDNYCFNGRC